MRFRWLLFLFLLSHSHSRLLSMLNCLWKYLFSLNLSNYSLSISYSDCTALYCFFFDCSLTPRFYLYHAAILYMIFISKVVGWAQMYIVRKVLEIMVFSIIANSFQLFLPIISLQWLFVRLDQNLIFSSEVCKAIQYLCWLTSSSLSLWSKDDSLVLQLLH